MCRARAKYGQAHVRAHIKHILGTLAFVGAFIELCMCILWAWYPLYMGHVCAFYERYRSYDLQLVQLISEKSTDLNEVQFDKEKALFFQHFPPLTKY